MRNTPPDPKLSRALNRAMDRIYVECVFHDPDFEPLLQGPEARTPAFVMRVIDDVLGDRPDGETITPSNEGWTFFDDMVITAHANLENPDITSDDYWEEMAIIDLNQLCEFRRGKGVTELSWTDAVERYEAQPLAQPLHVLGPLARANA
jgi:hypothetical protein